MTYLCDDFLGTQFQSSARISSSDIKFSYGVTGPYFSNKNPFRL